MRTQGTLVLAIATCLTGHAAAFDITLEHVSRQMLTETEIGDNGTRVGFDSSSFESLDVGFIDESISAAISQQGIGWASADAGQVSLISTSMFSADGSLGQTANASGSLSSARAGGFSAFVVNFSVTEPTLVDLSQSITWSGESVAVWARLRESGSDIFSLFSQGTAGTLDQTAQLSLEPGESYSINCLVMGIVEVDGPDSGDTQSGSFSLSMTPVPAPPGLALLGAGFLMVDRRRRGVICS